ncbi:hypothetical protein CKR_2296 [Clostridium kluyveri NBRC 12016]|uniref:Uncharacterized protein n=1 Tax=Clostridium kluyveri (strain NBRC 12016) TaxID=583346 RepID=B9E4C2_CLOK1|nr:hypothetical protein CKR_2296 [Clostridium kluyveri NBRC 12016]
MMNQCNRRSASIINIDAINSLFSLLESRFRFDTLDFQYLGSHSTKFQGPQLPHILKMETTLSISFPIYFEVFPEMVQLIRKLPRYLLLFSTHGILMFHHLKLLHRCNDPAYPFLPFFLPRSW